jgi:Domain of unknown function (DUF4345)
MNAPGAAVRQGSPALVLIAKVFFWAYILTVLGAGLWGMVGARLDFPILLHQQVGELSATGRADVLSQYRFLRGIEAAFGVLCIWQRREIFVGGSTWNRLFLLGMGFGILGRVLGAAIDGTPSWPMWVFLGTEVVGWTFIVAATRPWISAPSA